MARIAAGERSHCRLVLGVGLSTAVLLDATIVRALALPAVVALLGERRWRVGSVRRDARTLRPRPARV